MHMKFINVPAMAILGFLLSAGINPLYSNADTEDNPPNFIIILTDDQGYNDLGCYGSKTIKTPRIDRLAEQGIRFTSFYAQPVCGPSRGALMTGRYPVRIGGGWTVHSDEVMIPEILKTRGYTTACIGKWDMSGRKFVEGQLPNDQGFDYYFGTLGANDRGVVQLMRNRDSLDRTDDMSKLTKLYTDEALAFIEKNKKAPFFLYLAHTMPHVMIDASAAFKGKSSGQLYGDVVEEIDWNVGRIVDALEKWKLDKNTYLVYLSDNGPWTRREEENRRRHGGQIATGSAFPLRDSKGSAYEGGFRVPCIIRAPGKIPAGVVTGEIVASLDILPTIARLSGAEIPANAKIDGYDVTSLLHGETGDSPRQVFYYHQRNMLRAVRHGNWKLMLPQTETAPELYNLEKDVSESRNIAAEYPEIVAELLEMTKNAPGDVAVGMME